MKKLFTVVLGVFLFAALSYAQDYNTITEKNLDLFFSLYPQYVQMIKDADADENFNDAGSVIAIMQEKMGDMLKEHNITVVEFSSLMQRVSMGYAAAMMQQNGGDLSYLPAEFSDAELALLNEHLDELNDMFAQFAE